MKRSDEFISISRQLPALDRGELEEIRTRIGALLHLPASAPDLPASGGRPAEDNAGFLLTCISEALKRAGVEFADAAILRRSRNYAAFAAKAPEVMAYLERVAKLRQHQKAIFTIGIDLLRDDIGKNGHSVSARTLMNWVHRVPATLNAAFPGYASAGLLHMILIQDDARKKGHARAQRNYDPKRNPRRRSGATSG